MKIISCKIENFGKLSDVSFDFNDGLNVILKENGFGKSTLSAFIRVMFYGFEKNRARNDIENERKRFSPWQGGAYGGSLTFEASGKTYTVTRFFKNKEADDEFELRDAVTNLYSHDYSERLGEELFHINSESFTNTVFIEQNGVPMYKATDDINAKIGNISDGIDINRYAIAEEWFKNYSNSMSPTRKTGEIARMKADASVLKAAIQKGNGLEAAILSVEERVRAEKADIERLKKELEEADKEKNAAYEYEKLSSLKNTYDTLLLDFKEKETLLNERKRFFKKEIPSKETYEEWEKITKEIRTLSSVIDASGLSETEKHIYEELLSSFNEGIPDNGEINAFIDKAASIDNIRRDSSRYLLTEEESARLAEYNRLSIDEYTEKEVNTALDKLSDNNTLKMEEASLGVATDIKKEALLKAQRGILPILAQGFLFFIFIVVGFCFDGVVRLSLMLAGIFPVGIAVFLLIKNNRDKVRILNSLSEETKSGNAIREKINSNETYIRNVIEKHGLHFDDEKNQRLLQDLLYKCSDACTLRDKEERYRQISASSDTAIDSKKIESYLMGFNIFAKEDEYREKLVELRSKAGYFITLNNKVSDYEEAKKKADELKSSLINQLLYYDIAPGIDLLSTVDDMLDILAEYQSILGVYDHSLKQLETFKKANDIDTILEKLNNEDIESLECLVTKCNELNGKIEEKRNLLSSDTRVLDEYNERFEEWRDKKDELAALEEAIDEKLDEYSITNKTWEYLSKARENLTARYMESLLTGFGKYYGVLAGEPSDSFKIDANTVITKEENGKQRSTLMLSTGWQDLIGFCFRLAMADEMYKDEKPMLIMDDPFVNLDDRKIEGARKLLEEVGKNYQILYMTCREDRL